MPERQLHLFAAAPKPLVARLGDDFFRAIPRCPGVYIMTGAADRVLYVGQSKNLRSRLASYKHARPDRSPKKVIRLVHAVQSITWETCPTAQAARVRENELLRLHRPRFNRVNTYPQAYNFIWLKSAGDPDVVEIGRGTRPEPAAEVFGAFKTRSLAAYAALLRLLWAVRHRPATPSDFPCLLLSPRPARRFLLPVADSATLSALREFLAGTSDRLLELIGVALPEDEAASPFQRALRAQDLETLTAFYHSGPARNCRLCREHGLPDGIIPQEALDDLLA